MIPDKTILSKIEPLHSLKHDHRVIEKALRGLDGICLRLQWGERVPLAALSQVVDFISNFADCYHHGKEEAYLFPALKRQGIAYEGGPLGVMEHQHQVERQLTDDMVSALEGYKNLEPDAARRFKDAAHRYMNHLIGHMEREDSILFRIANEILDDEEKRGLGKAFHHVQSEFGVAALKKYEQVAAQLEEAWAV
jgi:hemerythrin-like domain-containing protein